MEQSTGVTDLLTNEYQALIPFSAPVGALLIGPSKAENKDFSDPFGLRSFDRGVLRTYLTTLKQVFVYFLENRAMNVITGDETGLLKLTDMGKRSYRLVPAYFFFYIINS